MVPLLFDFAGGPERHPEAGIFRGCPFKVPMRFPWLVLVSAALLTVAADALFALRGSVIVEQMEASLKELPRDPLLANDRGAALSAMQPVGGDSRVPPRAHLFRAQLFQRLAAEATDEAEMVDWYCQGIAELTAALRLEPWNARYLIGWANLRGLLGNIACEGAFTAGALPAVLSVALQQDPSNVNVLYPAALLTLWSGDRAGALSLFRRVVGLGADLSAGQRKQIAALLRSADDVRRVLVGRFPQIVTWTEELATRLHDDAGLRDELEQLQILALKESQAELGVGRAPRALYEQRLVALENAGPIGAARRLLDGFLSDNFRRVGDRELASFFAVRQGADELDVVRGVILSDSRPAQTSITRWEPEESVALDETFTSITFFVGDRSRVSFVELRGERDSGRVDVSGLKVFVSEDNLAWRELDGPVVAQSLSLDGRPLVAISLKGESHAYWKIHFGDGGRARLLHGTLPRMLHVYGIRRSPGRTL